MVPKDLSLNRFKGTFLSFSLIRERMNMNEYMINFDAFEGLQRAITLFRADIF